MISYELVYIFTNFIYLFIIQKLFAIFLDEKNCNLRLRRIAYILYFISLGAVFFISRMPIVTLLVNVVFLFLISSCYTSSFQRKILSISFIYSIGIVIEILAFISFGFFELSGIKEATFNSISTLIFTRVFMLITVYLINKYTVALKKIILFPKYII